MHQLTTTTLFFSLLSLLRTTTAQCEAPVPCQDESLNRLNTTSCQSYHAFIARGSGSGYPGHLGPLIRSVCGNLTKTSNDPLSVCGYENIQYPANSSWDGPGLWCKSAHIGVTQGQKQMREYAERCPESKLILLGFSQGGSVALDILGGGGGEEEVMGCHQETNEPLNPETSPGNKILAAVIFGAARRSANQSFTVQNGGQKHNGNATRTGHFAVNLTKFAPVLREYCNEGDPICAPLSATIDVQKHLDYFRLYNDDATEWVLEKARAANKSADRSVENNAQSSGGGGGESAGSVVRGSLVGVGLGVLGAVLGM